MGKTDKFIRLTISLILIILFASDIITGALGWVIIAIAVVFCLTSIAGVCAVYDILGINTLRKKIKL